jgi:hypothetical protein
LTGRAKRITPTAKQREAYAACEANRIVLYGGAIRGGKSYFLILYAFTLAFKYPKSRWLFLRESMPTMKGTLLRTFQEFLDQGFDQYVTTFNQQTNTVTLSNGSQFVFMAESYDTDKELNRFRGLEINGALIDEVNEIQEKTFDKIIERSGSWFHSPGCPIKIVMTCNPTTGWVKDRFYDRWKNGQLPDGQAYIPAKITDNPYIPVDYIESLKAMPRYSYEVFVNGAWDIQIKTGGEFYKSFELDKHVGVCRYDSKLPLHISWDENVNPYLPLGIFQIDGKQIRMVDEIAGTNPNNTITAVCNEFKKRYPNHNTGLFIYGDATADKEDVKLEKGHTFYTQVLKNLEDYHPRLRVLKTNPSVVMRGQWINAVLEKNHEGLSVLIDERCKLTINDFIGTKEAADGTKNKEMETDPSTKVRYQKYGHFTDLTDYFLCSAFAKEFGIYQSRSKSLGISIGKNKARNSW